MTRDTEVKSEVLRIDAPDPTADDWPIHVVVPEPFADDWLRGFDAEREVRGWTTRGLTRMTAATNSGTILVGCASKGGTILSLSWNRSRGGSLDVRARCDDLSVLSLAEARECLNRATERCRSGATERIHRRDYLEYEGRAWRGELWLDDTLRLGPPSVQDEMAQIGPRIIVIDALVTCFGPTDAMWNFARDLDELSVFLSTVLGTRVRRLSVGRVWTVRPEGTASEVRPLGYIEPQASSDMPTKGAVQSVPLVSVTRPDLSMWAPDANQSELSAPDDIVELWTRYRDLTPELQRQFLQAAAKWQEALMVFNERPTLSAALMVVGCEALKPPSSKFKEHNVYGVIHALLGKAVAEQLRNELFDPVLHAKTHPQGIRSRHLHRGEFYGTEFAQAMMMQSFNDPTFDQATRTLARVTRAAIIEWLRCSGAIEMPRLERKKKPRRKRRGRAPVTARGHRVRRPGQHHPG